ncbi:MAG: MOSC domain-containing protein [Nocardioides sp.]
MIDVDLPPNGCLEDPVLGFAACLASVLELPLSEVPTSAATVAEALGPWRSWLAGLSLGLVPIDRPAGFQWPGYWIALARRAAVDPTDVSRDAALLFGTPPGVVFSPQRPELVGHSAGDLAIAEGYVVAGLVAAPRTPSRDQPQRGTVAAIAIADAATMPMTMVDRASAIAGRGLAGDRYERQAGTFTPRRAGGRGYDLTLIENEAIDGVNRAGHLLRPADARRNIVTRGVDLNALVGRRFRIGDVECVGRRLCEPCSHLAALTSPGVLKALIHRGGLRADIVVGGQIELNSIVETIDDVPGRSSER